MMTWLFWLYPKAYFAAKEAAKLRHRLVMMPDKLHNELMTKWYPI